MLTNPEIAKHVLQVFLNINHQMDQSIVTVGKEASPDECSDYKRRIGFVMYEVFDKIIEPICTSHPSLRPPESAG